MDLLRSVFFRTVLFSGLFWGKPRLTRADVDRWRAKGECDVDGIIGRFIRSRSTSTFTQSSLRPSVTDIFVRWAAREIGCWLRPHVPPSPAPGASFSARRQLNWNGRASRRDTVRNCWEPHDFSLFLFVCSPPPRYSNVRSILAVPYFIYGRVQLFYPFRKTVIVTVNEDYLYLSITPMAYWPLIKCID